MNSMGREPVATPKVGKERPRARRFLLALLVATVAALAVPAASQAAVSLSGPSSFGTTLLIGDSVTQTYTFSVGSTAFGACGPIATDTCTDISPRVEGTDAAYFQIVSNNLGSAFANAARTFGVKFSPTVAKTYSASVRVYYTSGASGTKNKSVAVTATALAPTHIFDTRDTAGTTVLSSYDFGGVGVRDLRTYVFTVKSTGTAAVNGFDANITGAAAADFSKTTTCGAVIPANSTCTVSVSYSPNALGAGSASLDFSSSDAGGRSIALSGTGVPLAPSTAALQDTAGATPISSRDFGTAAIGSTTSSYVFTVRNVGIANLSGANRQTITGLGGSEYNRSTTCSQVLAPGATCTVAVSFSPQVTGSRVAVMTITPYNADPISATLTGVGTGYTLSVRNSQTIAGTGQKAWLDSQTIALEGNGGDRAKFTFDVSLEPGRSVSDVLISTASTTDDTAPADSTFINVPSDGLGLVRVSELPGGANRQLVRAEMSMNQLTAQGWTSGLQKGVIQTVLGNQIPTCYQFAGKSNNRRVWLRLRDDSGYLSAKLATVLNVTSANQCNMGPAWDQSGQRTTVNLGCGLTNCTERINGPAYLYDQRITAINGQATTPDTSQNPTVTTGATVTAAFKPRGAVDNLDQVSGVRWRLRNAKTGTILQRSGSGWVTCDAPCTGGYSTQAGSEIAFPSGASDVDRSITFTVPSRGRWIVEAVPLVAASGDTTLFDFVASINVNSPASSGPVVGITGAPPARPDTNSAYTFHVNAADPTDPISLFDTQGGRPTVIEWDLDNDPTNGPGHDGFEDRVVGDPDGGLPASAFDRAFDTTGKPGGQYTIRARVTDNGAVNGSDPARASNIVTRTFRINSPPAPDDQDVFFDADQTQPGGVVLTATDADGDPITYTVPVLQSTFGNLVAGGIDGSAASYTWNDTFTGIDHYTFTASDNHAGSKTATVRIHVRPNTRIDTIDQVGTPGTHATTETAQTFTFSSPQTAIAGYECRLDRDGGEVEAWTSCSSTTVGSWERHDLPDGSYAFAVRAVNQDGEKDSTPATYEWRVDTTAPVTEYVAGSRDDETTNRQPDASPLSPEGKTKDRTPQFKLRVDDASPQATATYECRIDYGPRSGQWRPCGSPSDATGSSIIDLIDQDSQWWLNAPLPEGTYTFEARATDEVGLQGPPTARTFTVDLTPPPTTVDSGPEGLINTRNVEWAVSSLETGATFDCKLVLHRESQPDTVIYPTAPSDPWYSVSGFRPCPGGAAPAFTGLADGTYTLTVAAVDEAGNSDPSPETVDVEVDATGPSTAIDTTLPVAQQARSVTVAFHGTDARDENPWYGPGSVRRFECRFDSDQADAWQPCQSPETYGGLADGTHTFEVRAIDQAGNIDPHPASATVRVDHTAPDTTITRSPNAYSKDATPEIEFAADEDVDAYECKLFPPGVDPDTVEWAACTSPYEPTVDSDGPWSVAVRATDLAGNLETTPATASWVQDTVAPTVTIDSHPADPATVGDSSFAFSAADETSNTVTTECKLDDGDFEACTSPTAYADLGDGPHTFAVKAIDAAGNPSTEASYDWGVYANDPAAPEIDDVTPSDSGRWTITTFQAAYTPPADPAITVQCSLDGGLWAVCPQSPDRPNRFTATGLTDGEHSFKLRAKDPAGNLSEVVERTWTVDTTAPSTAITSAPSGLVRSATADIKLASNEADATFQCRFDAGDWQSCADIQPAGAVSSGAFVLSDLAEGWHTLSVRAVDAARPSANVDPSAVVRTWKVDTTAPTAKLLSSPPDLSPVKDATFAFASDDPEATFQCKIGIAPWAPCTSPVTYKDLDEGDQRFLVAAVDPAGNSQVEPVERQWIIAVPAKPDDPIPPDDTPKAGSNVVSGKLVTGKIKLGTLPELVLTANQLVVSGTWDQSTGALSLPKDKIRFATISVDAGSVVPGATAKIILSATGDGSGTLPAAGGNGAVKVPVSAKVEVYAASGAPLLNLGASSNCTIGPINFDLSGPYAAGTKLGTFANGAVAVPGAGAGCGPIAGTLGTAIGIPSSTNAVSLDIQFSAGDSADTQIPDPGPGPDPKPPVPKEAAIKATVTTAAVSRKGALSVQVACSSPATIDSCSAGKLTLKAKVKTKKKKGKKTVTVTKTVSVGSAAYPTLAAGKTATVKVTLSKTGKKLAKPGRSVKVSTVLQPSATGAKAVSGTLTLKYAKPKKTAKKTAKKRATASTSVAPTANQGEQG